MDLNEAKGIVEALLFASDVPLSVAKLKGILGEVDSGMVEEAVRELDQEYLVGGRSFGIRKVAQGFQICTRPEFATWVRELYRGRTPPRLSAAALETLAITVYHQPVLRSELERVRGVGVDGVLATLLERGLIAVMGRDERPGRPLQYGTTRDFLRYFGLNDLGELPRLEELESFLQARERSQSEPAVAEAAVGEKQEPGQELISPPVTPGPDQATEVRPEARL